MGLSEHMASHPAGVLHTHVRRTVVSTLGPNTPVLLAVLLLLLLNTFHQYVCVSCLVAAKCYPFASGDKNP